MKRDPSFINSNLYTKNNKIYTKTNAHILFPKFYGDKDLLTIETNIFVYGVFAIVMGDKYSVSVIPAMIETNPVLIEEVTIDEIDYIKFVYGKDSVIIDSTDVARNKILTFSIFEAFFIKGKAPWFTEYEDLVKILDNMSRYAESKIGLSPVINEVIVSFISRSNKNKTKFHRQDVKDSYSYIQLDNTFYAMSSTLTKVAGSYHSRGIISALTQKDTKTNKITELVRR